jgi:hypothetical protein
VGTHPGGEFDGSLVAVDTEIEIAPVPGQAYSVSGWITTSSGVGWIFGLANCGEDGVYGPNANGIFMDGGGYTYDMWWVGATGTGDQGLTDGEQHHVAYTLAGDGTLLLYADGAEVGDGSFSWPEHPDEIYTTITLGFSGECAGGPDDCTCESGIAYPDWPGAFIGTMEDVQVYDHALDAGEVADLFAAGPGAAGPGDCDCDWEAAMAAHPDPYGWIVDEIPPLMDWDSINDPLPWIGTADVGQTITLVHGGFGDLIHMVDASCQGVPDNEPWEFWGMWDQEAGTVEIPTDLFNGTADALEDRHFGLWGIMSDWETPGANQVFLICPGVDAPPPIGVSGPHKAEEGDDVEFVADLALAGTVQWFKDGEALEGETTTELTILDVTTDDSGTYSATLDTGDGGGDAAYVVFDSGGHVLLVFPLGEMPLAGGLGLGLLVGLAGGLGLGLLVGACALAGAITIRRKK